MHLECIDKYEKTLQLEQEAEGLIEVQEGLAEKRVDLDEDSDDEKEAQTENKKETEDPEILQRVVALKEGGDFSTQIVENSPETKISRIFYKTQRIS